jgi:hypothetical protein
MPEPLLSGLTSVGPSCASNQYLRAPVNRNKTHQVEVREGPSNST